MKENRRKALMIYFKDKFLDVSLAKAFEAGWDMALEHFHAVGSDMRKEVEEALNKVKDCPECHGQSLQNNPEFRCGTCGERFNEPDGWLVWDDCNGRVFIEHPKGMHPNDARYKLEEIGKPVLGAVVFKDWKCSND